MKEKRAPTLWESIIPLVVLVILLGINVIFVFQNASLDGSNQMALILSAAVASLIALRTGINWTEISKGIVNSISAAMTSILILLLIGSLAGTWLISGIVPAMIYYGLQLLNPTVFLLAACVVSAIVSVVTGSSWSTIATIGIALLGIGKALGLPAGMIGGAIISGAYFGDKMSPLSDTTNLASAMAGTNLFTHIRYMMITTIPTMTITLLIFTGLGLNMDTGETSRGIGEVLNAINGTFHVSGWLFLVPVIVIGMIISRVPAIPALLSGILLGGLFAIIFQPGIIQTLGTDSMGFAGNAYYVVMKAMYGSTSIETGNKIVNDLLSSGGMAGMLNTIWLIISAMIFGGVMEASGMLERITRAVIYWARSTGSLIASTAATCFIFNGLASDQYLAIVVPGRMFAKTYRTRGLRPENLSRTLEDSGTVTSVLIPWNTCGATQASVLGVPTMTYAPFAFFNIISPFMTVLVGYFGIKQAKFSDDEQEEIINNEKLNVNK